MSKRSPLDRRRAWVVAAVLAALVVIAIGANAGLGDGEGRAVVTETVIDRAVLALIAFVVVVSGAAIVMGMGGPRGERRPRRPLWPTLVALALFVVGAWLLRGRDPSPIDAPVEQPAVTSDEVRERDVREDDAVAGLGLAAVGIVVAGLAVAAVVVSARRRPVESSAPDEVEPVTPAARDDAVARARACTDPRQAVLLAMAAAEIVLAADPATRRPRSTSAREWARAVRLRPLDDLVSRYEVARFSHHDVTDDDRTVALAALEALA